MSPHDVPADLISAREACKLLGVSLDTLHRWRLAGKLRGWRLVGRWRFSRTDVLGLLRPDERRELPPALQPRRATPARTPEMVAELKRWKLI